MNISVPTVKTHYAQAIKILRAHLERLFLFLYICGTHPIDGFACQLIKENEYENTRSIDHRENAK